MTPHTRAVLTEAVRQLPPDCFALVMATGVVSIASVLLEIPHVTWLLFGINVVAYGVLCLP